MKIKKLNKDSCDYLQNQVYKWLSHPDNINTRKCVTWADNKNDFETSGTDDTASTPADESNSYNFHPF